MVWSIHYTQRQYAGSWGGNDRDKLPHIWWNAGAQDYYMSSLLFTDENQNPGKNDLAASREYDENSNTYRFVLRDGVEFHDGTKLTSEDIRWNVRVCLETQELLR